MSQRDTPPFRADHVGSLLRPATCSRHARKRGGCLADELRAIEDEAIRDVVRMQEEVGLQSATDGEFRRASWHMDFIYEIDGITKADEKLTVKMRNEEGGHRVHLRGAEGRRQARRLGDDLRRGLRFLADTVRPPRRS